MADHSSKFDQIRKLREARSEAAEKLEAQRAADGKREAACRSEIDSKPEGKPSPPKKKAKVAT